MHLSDVVGHSGLAIYAEVALVLFVIAFVGIVIRTFRPGNRGEMDQMSRLPLEDDTRPSPGDGALPGNDEPLGASARRRANG